MQREVFSHHLSALRCFLVALIWSVSCKRFHQSFPLVSDMYFGDTLPLFRGVGLAQQLSDGLCVMQPEM